MSIYNKKLIIWESLFVHYFLSSLGILRHFEADVAIIFKSFAFITFNKDRLNLTKLSEIALQLFLVCVGWKVFNKQIVKLCRLICPGFLLFMPDNLKLFALKLISIVLRDCLFCLFLFLKLNISESSTSTIGIALKFTRLDATMLLK